MKNLYGIIGLFFTLGIISKTAAQSLRPPKAPEKIVLERATRAISKIVNLFADEDWEISDNNFDPDLYVPIRAGAHCGIGYSITFKLKDGTPSYNRVTADVQRLMREDKEDSLEAAYAKMEKESVIHMDIELNSEAVGTGTLPGQNKPLLISAASKAFIVAQDNNTTRRTGAFVLAFGNWQNAKYDSENKCYRFSFQHPPQSPYVENITIEIYGASDRINEVLQKADWNLLNKALTL